MRLYAAAIARKSSFTGSSLSTNLLARLEFENYWLWSADRAVCWSISLSLSTWLCVRAPKCRSRRLRILHSTSFTRSGAQSTQRNHSLERHNLTVPGKYRRSCPFERTQTLALSRAASSDRCIIRRHVVDRCGWRSRVENAKTTSVVGHSGACVQIEAAIVSCSLAQGGNLGRALDSRTFYS